MSRHWMRSDLRKGEVLSIPKKVLEDQILESKERGHLTSVRFVDEYDAGIRIELSFDTSEDAHYIRFVNWASIYDGEVQINKKDRTPIIARR